MKSAMTLMFCCLLAACATDSPPRETQTALAITNAAVHTMNGAAIANGTVVVRDGRIVAVGPADEIQPPRGARVIDARGKFLIPGLVDMHAHLPPDAGEKGDSTWRQLGLMVANGVTTARSMSGHPSHPEIRERAIAEHWLAPTLYVAAPAIHQGNTQDAGTARDKVRAAKENGFDLIKSHHLEDIGVWRALQDEARALGMPVAGHLASSIPLEEALRAGQQVEHLDGYLAALLPDESPARAMPFGQIPPPPVIQAIEAARIDEVAAMTASRGGWNVPTLALFEKIADADTATATWRAQPEMRYVPKTALDQWAAQREQLLGMGLMQAIGGDFVNIRRELVRALHAKSAGLMAGSDTPQGFHLSGFGLHEELAAMQRAGLAPLDALATATRNPRAYFRSLPGNGSAAGRGVDFGIIAPGERADLVLLNTDPAIDVAATRDIDAVVLRGTLLDRAALDALLEEIAASVRPAAAAAEGEVILLRHAMTEGHDGDPPLSAAGRTHAQRLAARFENFGADVVYATATRRAQETAKTIAGAGGADLEEYDPARLDALAANIRRDGGKAIVVGHSNTTPVLARLLGGEPGPAMGNGEYDRVYRINLADGATRMERPSFFNAVIEPCTLPGVSPPVRCGRITVPENDAQDARTIDVHFAVLGANGERRHVPLLVAPGGPGLGGVQSAGGIAQLFAPFREDRDILLFDQRGTGMSNRLDCSLPADLASAMASLGNQADDDIRACRDALSQRADLAAYTTPQAVDDLERIRQALGVPQLDVFGMSYGTRIATEYARQFPQAARALVIRAPAPPALQLPLNTPFDAQRSLERVAAACHAQPDCAAAYPDVENDVRAVLARLEQGPVTVQVVDPRSGELVETRFTREAFGSAMFFLLYIPEYYRQMPALVHAAAAGDFKPLVQSVAPLIVGTLEQVAWGLRWSVICSEDVARIDAGRIDELARDTFMGKAPIAGDGAACDLWPRASIDEAYFEPFESEHPVLIISGTMDPVAPPRWGDYMLKTLPNALHLPVEGASHLPVLPGCTDKLMREFLDKGSPKGLDTACARERQVPSFVIRDTGSQPQ